MTILSRLVTTLAAGAFFVAAGPAFAEWPERPVTLIAVAGAGDELVASCAKRAGRSMEYAEQNPLFGSIWTVEDFVRFLNAQPVAGAA